MAGVTVATEGLLRLKILPPDVRSSVSAKFALALERRRSLPKVSGRELLLEAATQSDRDEWVQKVRRVAGSSAPPLTEAGSSSLGMTYSNQL